MRLALCLALCLVLVTACVDFKPAGGGNGGIADAAQRLDAMDDGGVIVDPLTLCPSSIDLVGCWLMDGNGDDGSVASNDATIAGVSFVAGVVGLAAQFERNDRMTAPDNTSFDSLTITVEMWVRPAGYPLDDLNLRAGLFDKNGQFGVFLSSTGRVRCAGSGTLESTAQLALGNWTHIACVWEQGIGTRLFINASQVASNDASGLTIGGGVDLEIGSDGAFTPNDGQYEGAIDNLLVWVAARREPQLCATAGLCQ